MAVNKLSAQTINSMQTFFTPGPQMLCAAVICQAIHDRDWLWLHSEDADWWAEALGMEPGALRRHLPALMQEFGIRYDVWRGMMIGRGKI